MPDGAFLALHRLGLIHPMVRLSSRLRREILKGSNYNTDLVPNRLTYVDMVTDSLKEGPLRGTSFSSLSAMEAHFIALSDTLRTCFGYKHIFPIAQGRMAELVLAKANAREGTVVPSNLLFITTRYHQELAGATLAEIPVAEAYDLTSEMPFKGNMDTGRLQQVISQHGPEGISHIYVEACVNASGGHPVSMANIREVHRIAEEHGVPVIIDACRILENAWLIRTREAGYSRTPLKDIVLEFCSHSDGCTMSATKDFLVDTGGFITANDDDLRCRIQDALMVIGDGLSVKAKAALNCAVISGFRHETWVRDRVRKAEYLASRLGARGVPVVHPSGGHGVFIDARELYDCIPAEGHPIKAFLVQLYLDSGIMGSGNMITPGQEERGIRLIRLALPMQRYRLSHMDYVARKVGDLWARLDSVRGLRKVRELPCLSGPFAAEYEPEDADLAACSQGIAPRGQRSESN